MRRWLQFKLNEFRRWVARLELRFDQWRCPHTFRPARLSSNSVGRVCRHCEKVEPLSREEFFAYFGEVGGFNAW